MNRSPLRYGMLIAAVLLGACATPPAQRLDLAEAQPHGAEPPAPLDLPALELTPDILYGVLVGEVALQRGQYDLAVQQYLQLGRETRDVRLVERAARVAVYAHDNKKALEAAKLWVELAPSNMEARQVVSALYIRNGELDAAQHELETLLEQSGGVGEDGFMLIAGLLGRQQDKQAALQVMQKLIASRAGDPGALFAYSHLALRAGDMEEAESAITQVTTLQPKRGDAIIQRARIMTMRGKSVDAMGYLEGGVKQLPKDNALRVAYARLLVDNKQYEQAYEQFNTVNKRTPDEPDVLFALGVLSLQLEKVDAAEQYLLRLNRGGRGYTAESSYYLGRIAEEQRHDNAAAIKWYGNVDRGENYLEAQLRAAALMAVEGDVELARGHLRTIETRGAAQVLRLFLVEGQILRDADRLQEAFDIFSAGLEEMPDNTDLLYSRAMVAEKMDRLDIMEADLKHIVRREPENAEALNALGYTLVDRTRRYEEAIGYIKRALELEPDSHYILDSMGWAQYRLGNHQEAVHYLRRALEASPDAEIAAHLIEVLWVMGDQQAARQVWEQAVDASPENQFLLDISQRFNLK